METLLATPAKPFEVMIGKIVPYILVGYVQVGLIMLVATLIFHAPFQGSLLLLIIAAFFFIAANLSMGILFSTIARNQLQAIQMATFFFYLRFSCQALCSPSAACRRGRSGSVVACP